MTTAARTFDERSSHYYTPDGRPAYEVPKANGVGTRKATIADARKLGLLPSPTTLLKLLAKPQLDSWKTEQAVIACMSSPRREGEELDAFIYRVLHVDKEQDAERDAAADEGTAIHDAVECSFNDVEYPPKYKPYVDAVRGILDREGRVVATEKILVGKGYAGRTDAILENDHNITVVDLKGCKKLPEKGAWDDHRLQIAAYCGAIGNTGNKIVRGVVVYIDRNIPGAVIAHEVLGWTEDYTAFMHLTRFWYAVNRMEMPQ
jgi:hypothetical protein